MIKQHNFLFEDINMCTLLFSRNFIVVGTKSGTNYLAQTKLHDM
jgi:hypothetical protein